MQSETIAEIVSLKAAGIPQRDIAKQIGYHPSTVSRTLNNEDIRELVTNAQRDFILDSLPKAHKNIKHCIDNFLTEEDKQRQYFGYRASEKALEAIGLLGSQTPSVFVQQIFNTQNNILDPRLSEVLAGYTHNSDPKHALSNDNDRLDDEEG